VETPHKQARSASFDRRTERRAMIAVLAVFALLVQALVATPAMAMAAGAPAKAHGEAQVLICTAHGLQAISPDDSGAPADGGTGDDGASDGGCGHCVCPPVVTLASPATAASAPRAAYARTARIAPRPETPPPARAPPRPPGQGPPAPNA